MHGGTQANLIHILETRAYRWIMQECIPFTGAHGSALHQIPSMGVSLDDEPSFGHLHYRQKPVTNILVVVFAASAASAPHREQTNKQDSVLNI